MLISDAITLELSRVNSSSVWADKKIMVCCRFGAMDFHVRTWPHAQCWLLTIDDSPVYVCRGARKGGSVEFVESCFRSCVYLKLQGYWICPCICYCEPRNVLVLTIARMQGPRRKKCVVAWRHVPCISLVQARGGWARLGNDYWPIDSPSIKDRITKNRSYR